jgi:hexulose-6-phosphate isomerase
MILKNNKLGFIQGRLAKQKRKIQQFPSKNWKDEFRIAKKLKLELIEWTIDHYGFFKNPLLNKKYIKQIKTISKINNIRINSVTADFFMERPFWKRKNFKYYIKKIELLIKFCDIHKIHFIVLPLVDNSSIKNKRIEQIVINELKKLNNLLEKLKVNILFESDFKPQKLLKFIENFDDKNFGINYDLGNSASLSYNLDDEFNTYGKFIKNIHIKDRIKNGKTVRLGDGSVNFIKFFKLIKKINYKGPLILQTARSAIKGNDYDELKINLKFLKKILTSELR